MKVGDLVQLRDCYRERAWSGKGAVPAIGIVEWIHPHSVCYILLHNMSVEVLTKYYEVISENR